MTLPKVLSPLHHAVEQDDLRRVMELVTAGADVDERGIEGRALLHIAAALNNKYMCEILLMKGASTSVVDKEGKTPIHTALGSGAQETAFLLLSCDEGVVGIPDFVIEVLGEAGDTSEEVSTNSKVWLEWLAESLPMQEPEVQHTVIEALTDTKPSEEMKLYIAKVFTNSGLLINWNDSNDIEKPDTGALTLEAAELSMDSKYLPQDSACTNVEVSGQNMAQEDRRNLKEELAMFSSESQEHITNSPPIKTSEADTSNLERKFSFEADPILGYALHTLNSANSDVQGVAPEKSSKHPLSSAARMPAHDEERPSRDIQGSGRANQSYVLPIGTTLSAPEREANTFKPLDPGDAFASKPSREDTGKEAAPPPPYSDSDSTSVMPSLQSTASSTGEASRPATSPELGMKVRTNEGHDFFLTNPSEEDEPNESTFTSSTYGGQYFLEPLDFENQRTTAEVCNEDMVKADGVIRGYTWMEELFASSSR